MTGLHRLSAPSRPHVQRGDRLASLVFATALCVGVMTLPACKPATSPAPAPGAVAASSSAPSSSSASADVRPMAPASSGAADAAADVVSPIVAEPASIELGQMPPGALRSGTVQVRNTSSQPVTIAEVKTSCKCTTADSHKGRVLQPGESIPVTASYQSKLEPGTRNQNVVVLLEGVSGEAGRLLIPVTAEVIMAVRANPGFLTAFGPETAAPVPQFGSIVIESTDGKPFQILTADRLEPTYIDGYKPGDPPRSSYSLQWDLRGYSTPDCLNSKLPWWWVVETDHPDCPVLDVRIRHECTMVTKDPDFAMDRTREWRLLDLRINAGAIASGASTEIVVPTEFLPDNVELTSVSSLTPGIISSVEILDSHMDGPNKAYTCRLTPAIGQQGVIFGKVRFSASDGKNAAIWIIATIR